MLSSGVFKRFVHKRKTLDGHDRHIQCRVVAIPASLISYMHQNQNGCALVAMSQFSSGISDEPGELGAVDSLHLWEGSYKELQRGNEQCPGISKETEYCCSIPSQSSDNNDKRNGERLWKKVLHVLLPHVSLICLLLNLAFNQIDDGHKDVKPSKKS